ncbi:MULTISPECIES: hypothetical protein [Microbacterium]|uniref:hypothetical protein n=1 Tax=Microbacterium TaxID=33882 RepID=UPI0027845229|nr:MULTISPECIES: hypothetical protein [Microbacterium]MDQ1084506.1 hypothetical protein [Microbacterium sp. SORGH_AS_0344]MDQ1170217.1 hypothetical protein [Microbacterium proteolyticum]
MRIRPLAAVLSGAGLLAASLSTGSAAGAVTPFDAPSQSATTPLFADCSSVTPNGRDYARLHRIGLCGADTTPSDEKLWVESVGGEECGSATLTVTSRGGGLASLAWRVASTSGPVVDVHLEASFAGRAGDGTRRFTVSEPTLHAAGSSIAFLGAGRAAATLSGTVQTFTATCRVAPASVYVRLR